MSASSIATFAGDKVLYLTSATLTGAKPNTVECVKAIREIFTSFRVFGIRGLTCDKLCWIKSQQLNLVIEGPLLARERLCALRAILGVSVLPDVASPGRILYVIIVSHDDIKTLFNRISRTRPMSIKLRNEEPKADGPHKGMCYFGVRYYLDDISDSLELFKAGLRESLEPQYPVVDMSFLNDSSKIKAFPEGIPTFPANVNFAGLGLDSSTTADLRQSLRQIAVSDWITSRSTERKRELSKETVMNNVRPTPAKKMTSGAAPIVDTTSAVGTIPVPETSTSVIENTSVVATIPVAETSLASTSVVEDTPAVVTTPVVEITPAVDVIPVVATTSATTSSSTPVSNADKALAMEDEARRMNEAAIATAHAAQVELLEMRHRAYDMRTESSRLAEEASRLEKEAFRLELSIDEDLNFAIWQSVKKRKDALEIRDSI